MSYITLMSWEFNATFIYFQFAIGSLMDDYLGECRPMCQVNIYDFILVFCSLSVFKAYVGYRVVAFLLAVNIL